jgi:hypothetical protein
VAPGPVPLGPAVETFPLEQVDEAEQASAKGDVVKPVLLPAG